MIQDCFPDADYVLGPCPDCGKTGRLFELVPGRDEICSRCYRSLIERIISLKQKEDADAAA